MERSFARATRYGYKRARWRRLWRVQIQQYLTASIQNIMVLLRHVKEPATAFAMQKATKAIGRASKTRPCGLPVNHINTQWSNIAQFCRTLKEGFALASN